MYIWLNTILQGGGLTPETPPCVRLWTIQTMKQVSLASSLFVIAVRVDVTLYVQFLIKFTTVITAKPLQSHFTLVRQTEVYFVRDYYAL